jgi:hypothetical protein
MAKQKTTSQGIPAVPKDPLAEIDLAFLEMRRRFLRFWKIAGVSSLTFLAALFVWMLFMAPNLVNPFHVQRQIDSNALTPSALKVMAALMPLMVAVAFFLSASIILFGFSAYANERRYLKIIDSLVAKKQPVEDSHGQN